MGWSAQHPLPLYLHQQLGWLKGKLAQTCPLLRRRRRAGQGRGKVLRSGLAHQTRFGGPHSITEAGGPSQAVSLPPGLLREKMGWGHLGPARTAPSALAATQRNCRALAISSVAAKQVTPLPDHGASDKDAPKAAPKAPAQVALPEGVSWQIWPTQVLWGTTCLLHPPQWLSNPPPPIPRIGKQSWLSNQAAQAPKLRQETQPACLQPLPPHTHTHYCPQHILRKGVQTEELTDQLWRATSGRAPSPPRA